MKVASLSALAWEARRMGLTYGELAARLTPGEEADIEARYQRWKAGQELSEWGGNYVRVRTHGTKKGHGSPIR